MRVKKFLKKESQKNLKDFETEGDREFLNRMRKSVVEPPKKKRNKNWLWAIPSAIAACAVAVVLIVEFVPFSDGGDLDDGSDANDPNDVTDVKYDELNFDRVDSNPTELFAALDNLTINIAEERIVSVLRTYDSLSGDNLFYTMSIDDFPYIMDIKIVVNNKYEFNDFVIDENFITKIYSDYSVAYIQKITYDTDFETNLVQCTAKLDSEKYDIYITNYKEYSDEEGTFLEYIDNLFDFSS